MRTRPIDSDSEAVERIGVSGSSRVSTFLKDCRAGTDGVDIVALTDSTGISPDNSGYSIGMPNALSFLGLPLNSTPINASNYKPGAATSIFSGGAGAHNRYGLSYGTNVATECVPLTTAVTAALAPAQEIATTLGYDASILPKMLRGFEWSGTYVDTAVVQTSTAGNFIRIYASSPMLGGSGRAGVNLQYRVTYATFTQTGGSFKLIARANSATLSGTQAPAGSISTAGGTGVATATFDFATTNSGATAYTPYEVNCSWDGYSVAGYETTGPHCTLWHSVIEKKKGFGYSALIADSGKTTVQIADRIEGINTGTFLKNYLAEARARQIAAGGTGRVIVFCTSGQNGSETAANYLSAAGRITTAAATAWLASGFPITDLAFWFVPSHPQSAGAIETALVLIRAAANSWAAAGGNNTSYGITVSDISAVFTAAQMTARNLYHITTNNTLEEAHLRATIVTNTSSAKDLYASGNYYELVNQNDGYTTVATAIASQLLK